MNPVSLTQRKLDGGHVLHNRPARMGGGAGDGETCGACEELAIRRVIRAKLAAVVRFVAAFLSDTDGPRFSRRARLSGRSARVISAGAARAQHGGPVKNEHV
jgi:hypothetical protein